MTTGTETGPYVYWIVTGGYGLLIVIIAFWMKRWINLRDAQEEGWAKQGGLVTREMFHQWCAAQQLKCPALAKTGALCDWRFAVADKGGVLTKNEHTSMCKEIIMEVSNHWADRLEELFNHHREWVGQELKIITTQQSALNTLIQNQMKTEKGRWERHDEMKGRMPDTN
jgi:hypothetical protein